MNDLNVIERTELSPIEIELDEYKEEIIINPTTVAELSVLNNDKPILEYDSHRTKNGGVIISLINRDTGGYVDAFFNAKTTYQKGKKKNSSYDIGQGGQFIPPKGGTFRKFWMTAVGNGPRRWASVYKEINSKLKGKIFTGELSKCESKKEQKYIKVSNLRLLYEISGKTGAK
jgi:hypothetical protein